MIRRAVYDAEREDGGPDVVQYRALVATIPNPPYYPHAADLQPFFEDPDKNIFINDETGQMVVVALLRERWEVRLSHGLPLPVKITIVDGKPVVGLKTTPTATAALTGLRAVARAAELDMLARHPEAAEWRYWGSFQIAKRDGTSDTSDGGRALCEGWKLYDYPTAHIGPDGEGNYSMWIRFSEVTP